MGSYLLYRFRASSFNTALENFHLIYRYTLLQATPVLHFLRQVAQDLRQSPSQYQVGTAEDLSNADFESVGLHLLQLVNRGVGRRDNSVHLRACPATSEWTIAHLSGDKSKFAHGTCVENSPEHRGFRFVIHLGMLHYIFIFLTFLIMNTGISSSPLVGLINGSQHACISERLYSSFPFDNQQPVENVLHICPNQGTDDSLCSPSPATLSSPPSPAQTVLSLQPNSTDVSFFLLSGSTTQRLITNFLANFTDSTESACSH